METVWFLVIINVYLVYTHGRLDRDFCPCRILIICIVSLVLFA